MKDALGLTLGALLDIPFESRSPMQREAITAAREALAQPEPEYVLPGGGYVPPIPLAQPEQKPLAKVEPCAVCGEGKARLSVIRSCDTCHSEYAGQAEMKVALAQDESWSWVCNECGAREFTSAVSEADLEYLACAGCGCSDFHKEALAQPDYRAVKTYHEGKPVYVSQPEQEPVAWTVVGDGKFGKVEIGQHAEIDLDACSYWVNRGYSLVPLYTTPPKRPWVGLTNEEASWCQAPSTIQTWKRIEAKLKELNT